MKKQINTDELNFEKLYSTIKEYKKLIISLMLTATVLMLVNLYFKPSIYKSSAILEVKVKEKSTGGGAPSSDFLFNALSLGNGEQIDKEIEILKTFFVNREALEKTNFQISFYEKENFRKKEIYKKTPIEIENIEIYDNKIIGKEIILSPKGNFFTLKVKEATIPFLSKSLTLNSEKNYFYNREIKTDYFKLRINRKSSFNKPIYFVINGTKRQIYDEFISKNLKILQLNPNAPLLQISIEDNIPERANSYINTLCDTFIKQSIARKNEQNSKVLILINEQLKDIRKKLKESEGKLEKYKVSNQIAEPSIEAKNYIAKLSDLEIKLSENLLRERLIRNLIKFTQHNKNLDAIAPSLMELNDTPTLQLISSLQTLQLKAKELSSEFTERYPKLIAIKQQIYQIRQKILLNLKNLRSSIVQKTISLKNKKKSYEEKIKTLPKKEKKLVNLKRDYEVSSNMYNYLLKKKTENKLMMAATLSSYRIIDKAHTTGKPVKPKRALLMVVAPLVGLLLGIIIAVILQGLSGKINSKKELEKLTDLPLFGVIPKFKEKKNAELEVYDNPNTPFTESYRSLRSNLQSKMEKDSKGSKIILITSIIAGEGKTTITSNLASVFQMAGYRSIIINLDLRKPTLHNNFNLKNEKGMSGFLDGKDRIQDIISYTKYKDLHIINSGKIPSNPSELILSTRLTQLLNDLKSNYDYIFIDTAPIGLVSDTIHLMKYSDINLIVFRENYAEKSFIEALNDIIEKNSLNNVGIVLNYSSATDAYGYGYGYGGEEK